MFIFSVKAQNLKLMLTLVASVLVIVSVVLLAPAREGAYISPTEGIPAAKDLSSGSFKNIATNEDRIAFLNRYGWEVEPEAVDIREISIPVEFDTILEKYNQMQKVEGLDLEKYKGKSVKRYTYLVSNYDHDGSVYANLMIYKDTVIGGDISSAKQNGFVHGFTKGNDFLA